MVLISSSHHILQHLLHRVCCFYCAIVIVLGNPVYVFNEGTISVKLILVEAIGSVKHLLAFLLILYFDGFNLDSYPVCKRRSEDSFITGECFQNFLSSNNSKLLVLVIPDQNFKAESDDEEVLLAVVAALHDLLQSNNCFVNISSS